MLSTNKYYPMFDIRRSRWGLRSSGLLRSEW